MIQRARHVHMVALILACTADLCLSKSRAYKVKDSNEELAELDDTESFARSFAEEGNSGGFYGAGFHFPDFFNDGHQDGTSFGLVSPFVSPFPVLSESRSSDATYVVPAHTYSTGSGYDRRKAQVPHSKSVPGDYESRNSKKPITSLYDDWKPGDEQARSNKWSQEHDDDDSSEVSSPGKPYPSTPYKGHGGLPYSEASLKQHYKSLGPVGKTHGTNYDTGKGDFRVHQHKYGVSHIYDPKKQASDEHSDERYEDRLQDRKPQQFNSKPHYTYRNSRPSPPPPGPAHYGNSAPRGKNSFKPSPPDYFRNSRADRNYDFFSDSSKLAPKKLKTPDNHDQLDKSCVKTDKTTSINMSDGQIHLSCYECYDKNHKPYEQCVEVSKPSNRKKAAHKRFRRHVNSSVEDVPPVSRGKRQYDDYYEGEGGSYGPDASDYRFGPEHFNDDYPSPSYDEGSAEEIGQDYDSERCTKTRKGEMLCITCENRNSGGTYKQCSYASDPKKNSYERSVSKVYGSARLPEENRRKQVDGPPRRPEPPKRRPYSSPPPSGHREYDSDGSGYSRPHPGGRKGGSRSHPPREYDGPGPKYRDGSQGRSPLPVRGSPRSSGRTPASTQLRTSPRSLVRSGPRSSAGMSDSYLPARHPPPSSRAYSTPSPVGPDPFAYDLPDPYSPDPLTLTEGGSSGRHGARNRKNIDPSFDPGYDEAFASLFPELVGDEVDTVDSVDPSSAVALAPPTYDEYPDGEDYDEGPERRRDVQSHTPRNTSKLPPTPESAITHKRPPRYDDSKSFHRDKSSCKKVRKNKMTCYQCIDDKGTKHEECMYVAESEPESKHMTYREIKELRYDPYNSRDNGSRQNVQNQEMPNSRPNENGYRGKRKFKKYEPEEQNKRHSDKDAGGSSWESKPDNQRRQSDSGRDRYNVTVDQEGKHSSSGDHQREREKRERTEEPQEKADSEIDQSTRKNYNPIPTDPPGLDEINEKQSEDGEFHADMELKYDPVLGLSLPKYMLEKSEHEAIFDEVLASGRK